MLHDEAERGQGGKAVVPGGLLYPFVVVSLVQLRSRGFFLFPHEFKSKALFGIECAEKTGSLWRGVFVEVTEHENPPPRGE